MKKSELKKSKPRVEAIDDAEVDGYRRGIYLLTTITPLVDGPKRNTYMLDQPGLDDFLANYSEFAEFIVELKIVLTKVSRLGTAGKQHGS
jgi:hypothetical protein